MTTPEKSVEEIVEGTLSVYSPDDTIRDYEDKLRISLTQTLQTERQRCDEMVEKCIKEVSYYKATPRLRRDFCEWCDNTLLAGDNCDCKTETVRQELLELITMDLQALTQPNNK